MMPCKGWAYLGGNRVYPRNKNARYLFWFYCIFFVYAVSHFAFSNHFPLIHSPLNFLICSFFGIEPFFPIKARL